MRRTAAWPGQKGLPTPTGPKIIQVVGLVYKAQQPPLGPQRAVERHGGGVVPGLPHHGGVQVGLASAMVDGLAVAAGERIGEQRLQEVVMQ